jgi:meso-butanediol dehydrogenase/(S,S)-butanediol dehydrogenase/diacetyl reductase
MVPRFEGKVVVVTRAGSEIGAAAARRFHAEGATVVLCGRKEEELARIASDLGGDRCFVQKADVTVEDDVAALAYEVTSRFRKVDVLVNNAGTVQIGDFLAQTQLLTRAVLPLMIRNEKGAIVNVSTLGNLEGWGLTFYYAGLSVIISLTQSLAREGGPKGIRTNAVCPCITAAELSGLNMNEIPGHLRAALERIPMGRGAQPRDVASAIAFLASDEASTVNGVNLPVDGGLSVLFEFMRFFQ